MPISLKNMRGCASPASTAICTTDPRSVIRRSATGTPRRHHHRLNSYLNDQYNNLSTNAAPCISELPITPRSLYRKASSFGGDGSDSARRKSYDEIREYLRRRRSSAEIQRSPPRSSRYLLSETASFREDNDHVQKNKLALVISEPVAEDGPTDNKAKYEYEYEYGYGYGYGVGKQTPVYRLDSGRSVPDQAQVKPRYAGSTCAARDGGESDQRLGLREREIVKSASVSPAQSGRQVVVLRVSLHCKGCVGKLRKHLSRMEGVESFDIDLETKRVTVTGSMSPLDVLTSISKVKNAQFWPSPATSASSLSSSSSSGLSRTEINSM